MSDYEFLKLCRSRDARKVEEAIMNGANVNATDDYGNTALMLAASHGQTEVAEVLLKHGADVNAKNNNGNTALTLATKKGRTKTVELLRRYGAKTHSSTAYPYS